MEVSKGTKVLWSFVLFYLAIMILLAITVRGVLPLLMAENLGYIIFGALILQFIIFTVNKFFAGLHDKD